MNQSSKMCQGTTILFWNYLTFKDPGFKDEKVEKVENFMAKGDVSSALDSLIPKLCDTSALQEPSEEFIRLEDKLRTCINNFGSIVLPNNKWPNSLL